MSARAFEWDPDKSAANGRQRGLTFEAAIEAFDDRLAVETDAGSDPYGGRRTKITGRLGEALVTVVFTQRGAVTRVISARRASKPERRMYGLRDVHPEL